MLYSSARGKLLIGLGLVLSLSVVAVYFAWQYLPRVRWVLTALVCLLCVGAVYDRYHYVSDVLAGALVGLGAAFWITIAGKNEAPSTNVVDGDALARSAR